MKVWAILPVLFLPCCFAQPASDYLKSLINPVDIMASSASAAIGQWRDSPSEWRRGSHAYAHRFVSSFAQHEVYSSLLFGASHVLAEDNRYVPSGRPDFKGRLGYALASTVLARHTQPDGTSRRRLSISRIGALAGAAFLARYWQPRSTRGFGSVALRFSASVGSTMGFNVAHEFGPGWLPIQ